MGLQLPSQISPDTGHGLRFFSYKVEFAVAPNATSFANPQGSNWQQRLVNLQRITLGYGPAAQVAQFTTWDPNAIDSDSIDNPAKWIKQPQNGEVVRITINDGTTEKLVFKGTIRSVHEITQSSGVTWNCEVLSEIGRLAEVHITARFNVLLDPINPQPMFDADGKVFAKTFTVKEIIDQIMGYKDAWGTTEYFTAASIDWNGLDKQDKCGKFKPPELSFDNASKAQAIQETLAKAGNFTYIYDPIHDQIKIIELNRGCTTCGPQWPIQFVSTDAADTENDTAYAANYTVKADHTEWTTKQTANVCRIVSGPIRFYSGHHIIPEMASGDYSLTDGTDTAAWQKFHAFNPDQNYYRFDFPTGLGVHDTRQRRHYYVGAPLFPDWNIFEDWWPAMLEITEVQIPPDWRASNWTADSPSQLAGTYVPSQYKDRVEYQPFCVGDQVARGETHLGYQDNLRVYQAWYSDAVCPACKGSGLVKRIYNNNENEPNITLVLKGPTERQRLVPEVTNYLFKPSQFGTVLDNNVYGLEPFNPTDMANITGGYPLPWKHTCPFCRGIGMWPKYKIRNINQDLFAGRNVAVPLTGPNYDIPADPDATAVGPETWESAHARVALAEGPLLQVETAVMTNKYVLPIYNYKDLPFRAPAGQNSLYTLAETGTYTDANGNSQTYPIKRFKFPHPLQASSIKKQLTAFCVQRDGSGNWGPMTGAQVTAAGLDKVVPSDWGCYVALTTIQMGSPVPYNVEWKTGRVTFSEPIFIPCHKEYAAIHTIQNGKVRIAANGMADCHAPARGFTTADDRGLPTGYWRPARVWMIFTYSRERYYNLCTKKPDGTTIAPMAFTYTNADGDSGDYEARAMILDGRYAIEVRKTNPSNTPQETELGTNGRIIQTVLNDSYSGITRIEVTEPDFWKMPCPPKPVWPATPTVNIPQGAGQPPITIPNTDQDPYVLYKMNTAKYDYVKGRVLKWERTTPGEQVVEMAGYTDADHYGSLCRPKLYYWFLRDDRTRLLELAVRHLETDNNIKVMGSLELVGTINDTSTGLGWVNYPAKGKAAVVGLVYNFQDGFVTELELERQETRIGELPPKEMDRMTRVEKVLAELAHISDAKERLAKGMMAQQTEKITQSSVLTAWSGGAS